MSSGELENKSVGKMGCVETATPHLSACLWPDAGSHLQMNWQHCFSSLLTLFLRKGGRGGCLFPDWRIMLFSLGEEKKKWFGSNEGFLLPHLNVSIPSVYFASCFWSGVSGFRHYSCDLGTASLPRA